AEAQAVLPVSGADVMAHMTRVLALWVSGAGCKDVGARLGSNEEPSASNGWALGPTYTTSGHAMLLANPHAAWFDSASTFYEAHISLPTVSIYGATLVGFPVLLIAFNDHLGWTHTANTLDGCDTYQITPAGGTVDAGYLLDGTVHAYDVVTQTLTVKGADGQM